MTALPAKLSTGATSPAMLGAYSVVLAFERTAQSDPKLRRLIDARILGYLLRELPTHEARLAVALELNSCNGYDDLISIAKLYYGHFLRLFKKNEGPIPTPGTHSSRPSFETYKEMMRATIVEAPQDRHEAKVNALARDGYRCVVTGYHDRASVNRSTDLPAQVLAEKGRTVETGCAYIFAEFTNANISGSDAGSTKCEYGASLWTVLRRFGYRNIPDELSGNKIHRPQNVMTLRTDVHSAFDTLSLWFEPVEDRPNVYEIKTARESDMLPDFKKTVEFTTPDANILPVPSREYLALHAACARVAHLSGAGKYMDKIFRDMEDIQVLSEDGVSAELLEHALLPLSGRV